jgi:hypothetical protein
VATSKWSRFYSTIGDFPTEGGWVDKDATPMDWLTNNWADGGGFMLTHMWLIPRPIAERAGPWRENLSLGDDTEYFTRIVLSSERILFCESANCYYRTGVDGSLSRSRSADAWVSQFTVLDLLESEIMGLEHHEDIERAIALMWQYFAYRCYLYAPQLSKLAERRARALHSVRAEPTGGPRFRALARLLGWRIAQRLQVLSSQLRPTQS